MTVTDQEQPQLIALVRHGETEWNRERRWQGSQGVGLNQTGRCHAVAAARILGGLPWQWMTSSPAVRARQTAAMIADGLGQMPVEIDDELVEQHFGVAEGMPIAEADIRWPHRDYPGKEDRQAVLKRGVAAVERIAAGHSGNGIVVGHGASIRITLAALTHQDVPRILNGAVSTACRTSNGWELVDLNRTDPDGITKEHRCGSQ